MLRRTVSRRATGLLHPSMRRLSLALRPTSVCRVPWDRPEMAHRSARERPWWETAALCVGLAVFAYSVSILYYFGNRVYNRLRPSGDDIYVSQTIDDKLFSRPDLAVAALRMAAHHVLSGTQTPFGCPIVAPAVLEPEAHQLLDFVWDLHTAQPAFSIPDLWSLVVAKSSARLGGPSVLTARGRDHPPDFLEKEDLLVITPSLVPEDSRDVVRMKRVLASEGFSLPQLVALLGAVRTLGFHEAANFHTTHEVAPYLRQRAPGPGTDMFHLPDIKAKCTMDPYVFDSQYFNLLLDYNWRPNRSLFGLFSKRHDRFYSCQEKDRARDVVYVDPFSDQIVDSEKRRMRAQELAQQAVDEAERRQSATGSSDGDGAETTSLYGRSGEAQFIPGSAPPSSSSGPSNAALDAHFELEPEIPRASPCEFVTMRDVDVMLLDDALCRGWLYRYSANEIEFYNEFADALTLIMNKGYNPNKLHRKISMA